MPVSSVVPLARPVGARQSSPVSAVEVLGIGFKYGGRQALTDVSFSVGRAEIFGLLGPNGGGKTTLFKLISTLVPLQSGNARVLGYDLGGETVALRRRIGVVFQHPSVDRKLTVAENVECHGRLYGIGGRRLNERTAAVLKQLELTTRADDLVETLSGGLQRRVELAKALLHEPELLVLDEPSTGLDPAARRELMHYLTHLRDDEGVTIVLTTHHMEEAERCDRIGILHQGKLVAIAPPGELKSEVGGDVIVIRAPAAEILQRKILARFKLKCQLVDGAIRIEKLRGHELVRDLIDAFGDEIES